MKSEKDKRKVIQRFNQGAKEGRRMSENFFTDYKKFIVVPEDKKSIVNEAFDPTEKEVPIPSFFVSRG